MVGRESIFYDSLNLRNVSRAGSRIIRLPDHEHGEY